MGSENHERQNNCSADIDVFKTVYHLPRSILDQQRINYDERQPEFGWT